MPRYALLIEYDGLPYSGWQRLADRPSAQGAVEAALSRLDADHPGISAAGRTDTGVHATAQVAMCEMSRDWAPFRLSEALNAHLRNERVAILAAAPVPDHDWHPRFSALGRRYCYRILCRRAPPALEAGRVWHVRRVLDVAAMREAAALLIGLHDFTTFRSTMCQAKSPVKTLDRAEIESIEVPQGIEIRLHFAARSFLHNQVRSMVGTLERVGAGAWAPAKVGEVLAAADRSACGPVAPPMGLCLTGVDYGARTPDWSAGREQSDMEKG